MNEIILHLGTNVGDKPHNLKLAELLISENIGVITDASQVYETEAWGNTDQPSFLNKALVVQSSLAPEVILQNIHIAEAKMGRQRLEKWGPRTIDIDIIFYNDEIIKKQHLKIPHSELTNRNFVLIPLMEICPKKIHPEKNKTIAEIYDDCEDTSTVTLYTN